jgi:hypothetical protein
MNAAAALRASDPIEAILMLGMMVLVIATGAAVIARRWRGSGAPDRSLWSPGQIAVERRWRVGLGVLLIAGWVCMATALIDGALKPGVAESLPKAIGPVPLPGWFALAIGYHSLWYLLWANGTLFGAILDRRTGAPRPFKPVYGFICFLAVASLWANAALIWG